MKLESELGSSDELKTVVSPARGGLGMSDEPMVPEKHPRPKEKHRENNMFIARFILPPRS